VNVRLWLFYLVQVFAAFAAAVMLIRIVVETPGAALRLLAGLGAAGIYLLAWKAAKTEKQEEMVE